MKLQFIHTLELLDWIVGNFKTCSWLESKFINCKFTWLLRSNDVKLFSGTLNCLKELPKGRIKESLIKWFCPQSSSSNKRLFKRLKKIKN